MAEYVRDALLAEIRRALDVSLPEASAMMFAELERWIPPDGGLPHGPVAFPVRDLLSRTTHALGAAFPEEKGSPRTAAMLSLAKPWSLLAETTAWSANRTIDELRTQRFGPPGAQRPSVDWFLWADDAQRAVHMTNLTNRRRQELLQPTPPPLLQPDVPPGRFLVYWPDLQASDGSSQTGSHGFFDIFDAPPWDTWVHYEPVHHFLVSWVPLKLVQFAAIGIARNEIECHAWLDDIADPDHPRHALRLALAPWLRVLAGRPFP